MHRALSFCSLLLMLAPLLAASQDIKPAAVELIGWVSDGHCTTQHMKPGGEKCVRKCIAGATHVNPEFKPGGMVFVTEDKQVWKVDNPDALWGHESRRVRIRASVDQEKKSLKIEELLP